MTIELKNLLYSFQNYNSIGMHESDKGKFFPFFDSLSFQILVE